MGYAWDFGDGTILFIATDLLRLTEQAESLITEDAVLAFCYKRCLGSIAMP